MSKHSPTAMPSMPDSDQARFDQLARTRHADALANLSPQVRHRLQQARQQAALSRPAKRSLAWTWAGSAAVLAVALGVGIQLQHAPLSTPANSPLASEMPTTADQALAAFDDGDVEVNDLLAALDENPDFYLWLAANDGALSNPTERYP